MAQWEKETEFVGYTGTDTDVQNYLRIVPLSEVGLSICSFPSYLFWLL